MKNDDDELFEHIYPNFFTATILKWLPLLKPNKYKQLIINALEFLVNQKRVKVYGFVIMPNHIHKNISEPFIFPLKNFVSSLPKQTLTIVEKHNLNY